MLAEKLLLKTLSLSVMLSENEEAKCLKIKEREFYFCQQMRKVVDKHLKNYFPAF